MGLLIDSSAIIAAERGKLDWEQLLAAHAQEPSAISVITASELLHGVHRANESTRAAREAFVERILSSLAVVPLDLQIARVHASLSAPIAAAGQPVGAHDLLIAASAIAMGYSVVTRDLRSFPRIQGLKVIQA